MSQPTVVKLLPTDPHAAKIIRGETGRVWNELSNPTAGPMDQNDSVIQEADVGMGSTSPVYSMSSNTNTHWSYLASPPHAAIETYQPSPASAMPPPTVYRVATTPNQSFIQPVAASNTRPAASAYQVPVTNPTSPPTHYDYAASAASAASAAYYPSIPAYDLGQQQQQQQQQCYAGYPRQSSLSSPPLAYAVNSWPAPNPTIPPEIPAVPSEMMAEISLQATTTGSSSNKESRKRGLAGKTSRSGVAQGQVQGLPQSRARGSGSGSRSGGAAAQQPPVFAPASGSASGSGGGGAGRKKTREEPPVIVNGSGGGGGGAAKKERTPLVVDGSAAGKKGGHRSSRH